MLASGHNTLQRKEKSSEVKLRIHYFYFTPIRLDKGEHISAEDIQLVYWNFDNTKHYLIPLGVLQ